MVKIQKILEKKEIVIELKKRDLIKQYRKAKQYLLQGNTLQTKFKERHPKGSGIWYFRINKQYRALGVFNDEGDLIIFKIDNHQ
ncbi:hypothetical protein HOE67_03875 [Candidatus Peregrinibacteria bacterium]|jgi:plasmid maintenance system killer protein|nr:hypothetical protein [Candidatus Peregrinibacteria bacterium]MBT4056224.1 hypothetical protein [Candidatus Peregrinibacteria bacterium]